MNILDKKRMLEGILYNFNLSRDITEEQVDALILMRDTARKAGMILSADSYGRLIVKTTDEQRKQIAIGLLI